MWLHVPLPPHLCWMPSSINCRKEPSSLSVEAGEVVDEASGEAVDKAASYAH